MHSLSVYRIAFCVLILQLFLNSFISANNFGGNFWVFYIWYHAICKYWQFYFLSNLDAPVIWLLSLELWILCQIEVARVDTLVFFLNLEKSLSVFRYWILCCLCNCQKWLLTLRYVPYTHTLMTVFIMKGC